MYHDGPNPYGIDKDAHYITTMHPLYSVLGICGFTSSNDPEYFVECVIDESRYKVDDGYKVTLNPIIEGFGAEHFYQCDFDSLMKSGRIIMMDPNTTYNVVHKKELIQLTSNVHLVHEFDDLEIEVGNSK